MILKLSEYTSIIRSRAYEQVGRVLGQWKQREPVDGGGQAEEQHQPADGLPGA